MKSFIGSIIGLLLSVSVSAEPLVEGRVRLVSGAPAAGVQVRLFDLADLRRSISATTDEAGHFTLSLSAFAHGTALPQGFALGQNYPNPFNPSTIIPYQIPTATHVRLEVFNLLGQRIATLVDGERAGGFHTARWDATDKTGRAVGAGVYIYRLSSGGAAVSRRMVLIDGQAGVPSGGAAGPMPASALDRVEADAGVYGLAVAGAGLIAYVDPAFRVGVDEADIVVEEHIGGARMKLVAGGILGDVNNDGQVDASDALYVLLYIEDNSITLPNNGDISLGDLNEDGKVDLADAVLFVRYLADPADPALPTGIGDDHGDILSEATEVSLGSSTAGSLSEEDVDYFVIEISNQGTLLATTTGDTNTKGSILDSSGNVLASDSWSGEGSNFLVAVPVSPGTYYIRVEGRFSWETGDYTLEVRDNSPDLVVESPSVSPNSVSAGDPFARITLRATVRNQGAGDATSTTLTWYRSDDATIDATDVVLDTDYVFRLDAAETSEESNPFVSAPENAGTYYYGACVESVAGESNTDNNCSSAVTVTVEQNGDGDEGDGDDEGDEDDEGGGTTYGVGETLPNYPSGFFVPRILSGASLSSSGGRTTLSFNNGGFVELQDGTRYTCIASGGCSIESRRVTAGTIRVTTGSNDGDDAGGDDEGDGGGDDEGDGGGDDEGDDGDSDDDAISISISNCSGRYLIGNSGSATITITGTVYANRSVSFLTLTGFANGEQVGIDLISGLGAGESEDFSISGIISTSGTSLNCSVAADYRTSGSAKVTAGDAESSEQVRVQGSLSPSSTLINRKRSLEGE